MKTLLLHFRKMDWVMIAAAMLLVGFGLVSIYSSSLSGGNFSNLQKQAVFALLGLVLMVVLSFFDWRALKENSYLIIGLYIISLLLLAGLFLFAPEIRGTRSWYKFGSFSLDPIEPLKLVLLVILAKYFSARHIEMYRIKHIILSGLYVFIPSLLIFFQPNFGAVIILTSLWLGVLLISGIKIRHFLLLVFLGIILLAVSWQFLLKDYQKDRIISFVRPQIGDTLKVGWNQRQSKIAIGSGGILGQGIGNGSQTQYGFLPEAQTDFVFASLAEETGLLGVSVMFFLFLILIWRIMRTAIFSNNNFIRFFASGFNILLISEIFINVGMNIGLLPIIGIPLPFVSYGGSGLLAVFTGLGLLQSIKANQ